jgi:hypothetical protein
MPRKSSEPILALSSVTDAPPRLTPPSFLTNAEETLFNEIVRCTDPKHFRESDRPLLAHYVQACLIARDAGRAGLSEGDGLAAWERATRVMVLLATKLRLTPQARSSPKTVAREPRQGPQPWEIVRDVKVVKTVDEEL